MKPWIKFIKFFQQPLEETEENFKNLPDFINLKI